MALAGHHASAMYTQAESHSLLDHPWRIAALVTIVANVTLSYASEWLYGQSMAAITDRYQTLLVPADYAFGIWGLIYGATLAYAVLALLPSQLSVRFHDRVAPWLLATNVLSSVWIALYSSEQLPLSVLVMLLLLGTSAVSYKLASEHLKLERLNRWWRAPFALWFGWLAVAMLVSVSVAIAAAGWDGWPVSETAWTVVMLGVAATIALGCHMGFRDPIVALVVSWATAAVAIEHWRASTLVGIVATLVAVKTLLWGVTTLVFEFFPMPLRYRRAAGQALRYDPAHPDSDGL
jgi:hypothetical protein